MNVLVVYDSQFGNTERVAHAVAERLHGRAGVMLTTVERAPSTVPDGLGLLIVGGPTQGHGASPALRSWLDGLDRVHGVRAAAFDTRFAKPRWLVGSAARVTAQRLGRLGFRLVRGPESFFVAGTRGPLLNGELDRAGQWADTLADQLTPATTAQ